MTFLKRILAESLFPFGKSQKDLSERLKEDDEAEGEDEENEEDDK